MGNASHLRPSVASLSRVAACTDTTFSTVPTRPVHGAHQPLAMRATLPHTPMLRYMASRFPSMTRSGSSSLRPTAGTTGARSCRCASLSSRLLLTTRRWRSESRQHNATPDTCSASIRARSKRLSPTIIPTLSPNAATATSHLNSLKAFPIINSAPDVIFCNRV